MLLRRAKLIILFTATSFFLKGQDAGIVLPDSDSAFAFSDSLTIFQLIDSLMTMPAPGNSQLAARVSYNSNVLSAGRTLGIEQFGLSPGVSYYHKSGAYADLAVFWSNDFDPSFYLTTTSVGYMHIFSPKFSAMANYDHYFYNFGGDLTIPYSNAFTVSPCIELKPFSFRLDYSFYFGDAHAHRIMPGLGLNLEKNKFLGIDRISFYPSVYVLFGNETLTVPETEEPGLGNGIGNGNGVGIGLTKKDEKKANRKKYSIAYSSTGEEKEVFGIMNYAFSLPLNLSHRHWTFNVTYTYSIPRALEDELLILSESTFLSASVIRYIDLSRNKKSL